MIPRLVKAAPDQGESVDVDVVAALMAESFAKFQNYAATGHAYMMLASLGRIVEITGGFDTIFPEKVQVSIGRVLWYGDDLQKMRKTLAEFLLTVALYGFPECRSGRLPASSASSTIC